MTTVYFHYLQIARLVARRARIIKLLQKYPNDIKLNAQLRTVARQLMYHQTYEGIDDADLFSNYSVGVNSNASLEDVDICKAIEEQVDTFHDDVEEMIACGINPEQYLGNKKDKLEKIKEAIEVAEYNMYQTYEMLETIGGDYND